MDLYWIVSRVNRIGITRSRWDGSTNPWLVAGRGNKPKYVKTFEDAIREKDKMLREEFSK